MSMHWYVRWCTEEFHRSVRRENIELIEGKEDQWEIAEEREFLITLARCIRYNLKRFNGMRNEGRGMIYLILMPCERVEKGN